MRSNDGRSFTWHKDIKMVYVRVLLHPTPSGAPSRREPFDISVVIYEYNNTALWPSGKAKVCNTSIPGSIPGGASNATAPNGCVFLRWRRHQKREKAPQAKGLAESGSHIRPKSVGELAHQRRGRDIFAAGRNSE